MFKQQWSQIGAALIGILLLAGGLSAATWATSRAGQLALIGGLLPTPSLSVPIAQCDDASQECLLLKS